MYCTEQTVLGIKSMGWNSETKYTTSKVLLITELSLHNLKAHQNTHIYVFWTSSRRTGGRGNLGCWWQGGDRMWNIKKPLVGSKYDMAYFVLPFIPGAWQIISQLVCNESAKISPLVVVCGGGCHCWRRQYNECLCYCPLHPGRRGCVASLVSLSKPVGLI